MPHFLWYTHWYTSIGVYQPLLIYGCASYLKIGCQRSHNENMIGRELV